MANRKNYQTRHIFLPALMALFFVDSGAICVLQRPLAHSSEKVYSGSKKFTKGWGCAAMISPKNVRAAAEKREDENLRFRTFLKIHADLDELDRQFLALHRELFDGYDCCQCGNCCREYSTSLLEEEIVSISAYLGMTRQKFVEDCLLRGRDGLELPAPAGFSKWMAGAGFRSASRRNAGVFHTQIGPTA